MGLIGVEMDNVYMLEGYGIQGNQLPQKADHMPQSILQAAAQICLDPMVPVKEIE